MGKVLTTLAIIILVLAATVVIVAQPNVPKTQGAKVERGVAKLCLLDIPRHYDSSYLTYMGHVKAWYYHWSSKFGLGLDQQQKDYLVGYSLLQEAVNCYVSASGDSGLNMALSSTEFSATYDAIAEEYNLQQQPM